MSGTIFDVCHFNSMICSTTLFEKHHFMPTHTHVTWSKKTMKFSVHIMTAFIADEVYKSTSLIHETAGSEFNKTGFVRVGHTIVYA